VRTGALSATHATDADPASASVGEGSGGGRAPCAACGAPLRDDQDWCLQCGAARAQIRRPPDWRIPAALIGVIVGLIVIALLIALVSLSIQANHG
jgi:hypothetical protein